MHARPNNALTVDVEDWFHVCGLPEDPVVRASDWRVRSNVSKLLALLADYHVRATFFVLGSVAEALPEMVREIAAAGHEIASHGYSHRLVRELSPASFRDELRRTGEILERESGRRPVGFRAPQWSIGADTPWALEILVQEGYRYDSSLNPLRFVGDPAGRRTPHRVKLAGGTLWEVPPTVTPSFLGNLPTGGGWGFRLFPRFLVERTVRALNREGEPAVIYLHPREVDPDGPRLPLSPLRRFAAYGTRSDASERLTALLGSFSFGTLGSLVEEWESA